MTLLSIACVCVCRIRTPYNRGTQQDNNQSYTAHTVNQNEYSSGRSIDRKNEKKTVTKTEWKKKPTNECDSNMENECIWMRVCVCVLACVYLTQVQFCWTLYTKKQKKIKWKKIQCNDDLSMCNLQTSVILHGHHNFPTRHLFMNALLLFVVAFDGLHWHSYPLLLDKFDRCGYAGHQIINFRKWPQ